MTKIDHQFYKWRFKENINRAFSLTLYTIVVVSAHSGLIFSNSPNLTYDVNDDVISSSQEYWLFDPMTSSLSPWQPKSGLGSNEYIYVTFRSFQSMW